MLLLYVPLTQLPGLLEGRGDRVYLRIPYISSLGTDRGYPEYVERLSSIVKEHLCTYINAHTLSHRYDCALPHCHNPQSPTTQVNHDTDPLPYQYLLPQVPTYNNHSIFSFPVPLFIHSPSPMSNTNEHPRSTLREQLSGLHPPPHLLPPVAVHTGKSHLSLHLLLEYFLRPVGSSV